ncbi:MAG: hypothetical protein RRC34_08185 [Lentisphaeria bacterium]|nr:hypothetical protein [Lentisphaeria bacterium]
MISHISPNHASRRNPLRRSYTLIELLMVLTLFTLAAVTVASVAGGGLKIYRRAQFISGAQTDLLLGMERLEKELRSCFTFDTIGFAGSAEAVSFPGMVFRWDAMGRELTRAPGRITYRLDRLAGGWARRDQSYSQATREDGDGETRLLAADVRELHFEYCKYDQLSKTYTWQSAWSEDEEGMPTAVRVRVRAATTGGIADFERTLLLPAGSRPWQAPLPERDDTTGTVK